MWLLPGGSDHAGCRSVKEKKNPSDDEILEAMQGNICRCGCYERIVAAVRLASTGS